MWKPFLHDDLLGYPQKTAKNVDSKGPYYPRAWWNRTFSFL